MARQAFATAAPELRRLQLYFGPMWSGKTNRLIQQVDATREHYGSVVVIKHAGDTRSPGVVRARTGLALPADVTTESLNGVATAPNTLYAVDEGQFFGDSLLSFWRRVAVHPSSSLVVAALDLDYQRQRFGAVLTLAEQALREPEPVTIRRLAARCTHDVPSPDGGGPCWCGAPAVYSQRLVAGGSSTVSVGGGDKYQPACAAHHVPTPIHPDTWSSRLA